MPLDRFGLARDASQRLDGDPTASGMEANYSPALPWSYPVLSPAEPPPKAAVAIRWSRSTLLVSLLLGLLKLLIAGLTNPSWFRPLIRWGLFDESRLLFVARIELKTGVFFLFGVLPCLVSDFLAELI